MPDEPSAAAAPVGERLVDWAARTSSEDAAAESLSPRAVRDGGLVELREVTTETVRAILRLDVEPSQRGFVAPNAVSFAEALFEPKAWYRAIVADDRPVGFVMLSINQEKAEYYLWRFMIDAAFQGHGYGRAALALIVDHVRTLPNATRLLVSWVPEPGGPEPFYRGRGFVPTGVVEHGEVEASLAL